MQLQLIQMSQFQTQCDYHTHGDWEICLNISGEGDNYFGEEITPFGPGSIYVCPPDIPHKKIAAKGEFQDISMLISGIGTINKLNKRFYTDTADNQIKTLMFILYDVYHNKPYGYHSITSSLTDAICNLLVSLVGNEVFSHNVELVKNEIIINFINPEFKIEQALAASNYNIDYMRRCFIKEMNMSPIAYLNHLRIENAKKLLQQIRNPKYTISEAASMSGFYDAGYFSRLFKKTEGISPKKYAQMFNAN